MPASTYILIFITVISAGGAVYGGITGREGLLAAGLTIAFLSGIFAPIIHIRARKKARIRDRQDALLIWYYSLNEAARIAEQEAKKTRKSSIAISILMCICLIIIFLPFTVITQAPENRFLIIYIGAIVALLPFTSVFLAPMYTANQILKQPSVTIIGRDYILVNNRYIGINDRAELTLKGAAVKLSPDGTGVLSLDYTFKMRYGHMHYTAGVPIPQGRIAEAEQFKDRL